MVSRGNWNRGVHDQLCGYHFCELHKRQFPGNAAFQINTAGRAYTCRFTCAASGFEYVAEDINQRREAAKNTSGTSPAQQILEYKQLLDAGVITASEFEAKKKQLLNL